MVERLTDPAHFVHVLALLNLLIWGLVIRIGRRAAPAPRLLPLVLLLVPIPYVHAGLGLATLSLGLLVAADRLSRVGGAAEIAAGGLLALGGAGLMLLSPGGPQDRTWWIGLGTAAFGVMAALLAGLWNRRAPGSG